MDNGLPAEDDWVDVGREQEPQVAEPAAVPQGDFPDLLLVFENQRWYVGIGWDAPMVSDRPQWSNGDGSVGVAVRPPWMDAQWKIDLGGVPTYSDDEGWAYGFNMSAFAGFDALGSKDPTGAFVRRRRWILPASSWPKDKKLPRMISIVRPVLIGDGAAPESAVTGADSDDATVRRYSANEILMDDIPGATTSSAPAASGGEAPQGAAATAGEQKANGARVPVANDGTLALPHSEGDSVDVVDALREASEDTSGPPRTQAALSATSTDVATAQIVENVDIYEGRNMVQAAINHFNGDGFAGLASSLREAVNLAVKYARRIPEPLDKVFFTWHHPDLNEVALFGMTLSQSRWANRVYVWTEERAKSLNRADPNAWARRPEHTSGIIYFRQRQPGP